MGFLSGFLKWDLLKNMAIVYKLCVVLKLTAKECSDKTVVLCNSLLFRGKTTKEYSFTEKIAKIHNFAVFQKSAKEPYKQTTKENFREKKKPGKNRVNCNQIGTVI